MINFVYLMLIVSFLFVVFAIRRGFDGPDVAQLSISTEAEASVEMEQKKSTGSNMNALENMNVSSANTTSKIAEYNDREYGNNDSINKSHFNKEADGSLSLQIQQMILSDIKLAGRFTDIKAVAVNGRVTLRGVAKSKEDRKNIVRQVEKMAGVDSVDNQIKIEGR